MKQDAKKTVTLLKFKNSFSVLGENNWILTVVFFLGMFFASVWIWYQVVVGFQVDGEAKKTVESSGKDYALMMKEIKTIAEFLEKKRQNFNGNPPIVPERELFFEEKNEAEAPASESVAPTVEPNQ